MNRRWNFSVVVVSLTLAAAVATAQEGGGRIEAIWGLHGKVVKGVPYSASAVTEFTHTLGDGNKIVKNSTASVARDSEGRTRRDQGMSTLGQAGAAGRVFIKDPVAGLSYMLNTQNKTAVKFAFAPHTGNAGSPHPRGPNAKQGTKNPNRQVKTESLGTQTIEGIEAQGTRTTLTLAAGSIGNQQPIQVVTESWYSSVLQTIVLSKRNDPRFGQTTFRLTGISQGEPDASLFGVPSDYTVSDGPAFPRGRGHRGAGPAPSPAR